MITVKPFTAKNRILNTQPQKLLCLALLICCVAVGCDSEGNGPQRAPARGTVTVDGEPLENGMLQFTPTQGNSGPVAGTVITNGEYSVAKKLGPVVGTNRVQISGTRKTGKTIKTEIGMLVDERISVVPEQYDSQSFLIREVKAGNNVFDFALSSDGSTE